MPQSAPKISPIAVPVPESAGTNPTLSDMLMSSLLITTSFSDLLSRRAVQLLSALLFWLLGTSVAAQDLLIEFSSKQSEQLIAPNFADSSQAIEVFPAQLRGIQRGDELLVEI